MNHTMTTEEAVWTALEDVYDPEIPNLSLVDLGMVYAVSVEDANGVNNDGAQVYVRLLPTFVGCPALEFIKARVVNRLLEVTGVSDVNCAFVMDETWTTERISQQGKTRLEEFGIAPPPTSFQDRQIPSCPYCKAEEAEVVSLFGPTACRAIFYCKHCQQPFEGMKYI
jgi:ring-1,2-phenylacetyl-CoA epoxidase subunit PaaD